VFRFLNHCNFSDSLCYTKTACQLKCSPKVRSHKVLKENRYQEINIQSILRIIIIIIITIILFYFIFSGSAAQRGLWPPVAGYGLLSQAMASCRRLWPPVSGYGLLSQGMASSFTRFLDHTQRRTTVGRTPLDEWSARRRDFYLTTQHTQQTNIHTPGGIRTHDRSRRSAVELRFRPRGHWDRRYIVM
jgi:hypothetical protein